MAADHFCLIWNNFQNSILSALGNLQTSQDLVDVTLMCEGKNVRAHKVILSACSPYFRNLFKEIPCQHPVIILKDVSHYDLTALLQFMYQGEVMVTQECLASFLKTAELLQISGLAGTNAGQPVSEPSDSPPRAPPDPIANPPDSPGTVISKINSDLSLTKQKRTEKEKEPVEKISATESDPEQSCSYTTAPNVFIKTESMDREYDDMDTDSTDMKGTTNESFDTSVHGEEPSILERSLKAQSVERELLASYLQIQSGEVHIPTKLPANVHGRILRKRCRMCSETGRRKDTTYRCMKCPSKPPLCLGSCFENFHNK